MKGKGKDKKEKKKERIFWLDECGMNRSDCTYGWFYALQSSKGKTKRKRKTS
jgi:hypothetical protein